MRSRVTQPVVIALALLVGYVLGAMRAPAQADDSGKVVDLLREIARSQAGQVDALKQLARASERCAR